MLTLSKPADTRVEVLFLESWNLRRVDEIDLIFTDSEQKRVEEE